MFFLNASDPVSNTSLFRPALYGLVPISRLSGWVSPNALQSIPSFLTAQHNVLLSIYVIHSGAVDVRQQPQAAEAVENLFQPPLPQQHPDDGKQQRSRI
jgi:hypothetical protein